MDPAEEIVQGALDNHRNMINQFKGTVNMKRLLLILMTQMFSNQASTK